MEELYRHDFIKKFLKNIPNRLWKPTILLLIEYSTLCFENTYNLKNLSYNDIFKAVNDAKGGTFFSGNNRQSNKDLISDYSPIRDYDSLIKSRVGPTMNTNNFSPMRTSNSFITMKSNPQDFQGKRVNEAFKNSPRVKKGKFVILDDDPENNEVIIKLNKCTFEEQLRDNKSLIFDKNSCQKAARHSPKREKYQTNYGNFEQDDIKAASVNDILDRLKQSPKKDKYYTNNYNNKEDTYGKPLNKKNLNLSIENRNDVSLKKNKKDTNQFLGRSNSALYIIKKSKSKPKKKIYIQSREDSNSNLSEFSQSSHKSTEEIVLEKRLLRKPSHQINHTPMTINNKLTTTESVLSTFNPYGSKS